MKAVHGSYESPFAIRHFIEGDPSVIDTSKKILEKSEFKSYYTINNKENSNFK